MASESPELPTLGDLQLLVQRVKATQNHVPKRLKPPDEGLAAETEQVLASSLTRGTRGYIERIVTQINGAYEHGWFDACAVMIRRLLETVIIEVFESKGLAHQIKNPAGDFLYLSDLVDATLNEASWNLGRNAKRALKELKAVGDRSAHSRRFIAHRHDIDRIIPLLRDVIQELVYLAGLK
jgi:hypothetical protein